MRDEDWKRRAQVSAKHAAESRGMSCLAVGAGRHSQARDEHLTHRAATNLSMVTCTPRIFHRIFPLQPLQAGLLSPQRAGGTATHLWREVGQSHLWVRLARLVAGKGFSPFEKDSTCQ